MSCHNRNQFPVVGSYASISAHTVLIECVCMRILYDYYCYYYNYYYYYYYIYTDIHGSKLIATHMMACEGWMPPVRSEISQHFHHPLTRRDDQS